MVYLDTPMLTFKSSDMYKFELCRHRINLVPLILLMLFKLRSIYAFFINIKKSLFINIANHITIYNFSVFYTSYEKIKIYNNSNKNISSLPAISNVKEDTFDIYDWNNDYMRLSHIKEELLSFPNYIIQLKRMVFKIYYLCSLHKILTLNGTLIYWWLTTFCA